MNPIDVASAVTGLPKGKPKHARGKKSSGKPFAHHVGALQKAHGAGDLAGVKSHALNLANAIHKHLKGQSLGGLPELPADENETPGTVEEVEPNPIAQPSKNNRAKLAQLAMARRK